MHNFLARLSSPTRFKRFILFFCADILIITFSLYLSFLLRFDFSLGNEYLSLIFKALPLFIIVKLAAFAGFRMYSITWKYVRINDLCNIVSALIVANSVLMILILLPLPPFLQVISLLQPKGFPRSIFLIDGISEYTPPVRIPYDFPVHDFKVLYALAFK